MATLKIVWLVAVTCCFLLMSHGEEIRLGGAGASFPAEIYRTWLPSFESYRSQFKHLKSDYLISSSGFGRSYALVGTPAYTGSEIPLVVSANNPSNSSIQSIPVLAG